MLQFLFFFEVNSLNLSFVFEFDIICFWIFQSQQSINVSLKFLLPSLDIETMLMC